MANVRRLNRRFAGTAAQRCAGANRRGCPHTNSLTGLKRSIALMPTEERNEQLNKAWDEVNNRLSSNSQIFSKSILSLSSAGLGLSLGFIKNIVPLDVDGEPGDLVIAACLLYVSCTLFGVALVSTISAFFTSQRALEKQSAQIKSELAGQNDIPFGSNYDALYKPSKLLAFCSIVSYIFAVSFMVLFIILN